MKFVKATLVVFLSALITASWLPPASHPDHSKEDPEHQTQAGTLESPPHLSTTWIVIEQEDDPSGIAALLSHPLVKDIAPVFDRSERKSLHKLAQDRIARSMKITLDSNEALDSLRRWMHRTHPRLALEPQAFTFTLSSDRFRSQQWALENKGQTELVAIDDLTTLPVHGKIGEDVGLARAPQEKTGVQDQVIVAVLDTGISYEHPDLEGKIVEKAEECKAFIELTKCDSIRDEKERRICQGKYKDLDNDGNGYPLDCSGWNTTVPPQPGAEIWGSPDAADENGHGTHVAGIIAADENSIGVQGVAQNVRILPVKVITASPTEPIRPQATSSGATRLPLPKETPELKQARGFGDLVARGMLYAIRSGAKIINLSLGWPSEVESRLMQQMVALARSEGILVVAAAGNDATDALVRPCVYPGVICVASHDPDGSLSTFSNYGSGVDVAAPGLNILSTWPEAIETTLFTEAIGYEVKSGTSMAAPHVSGVLARLLNAGHSPRDAYARLIVGARPHQLSTLRPRERRPMYTLAGNIDLANAMEARRQPLFVPVEKTPISVLWNRVDKDVPIRFKLRNAWSDARDVEVELTLLDQNDVKLSRSHWSFSSWDADETKDLATSLQVLDERWLSELKFEARIRSYDRSSNVASDQSRVLQAEVRSLVGPQPKDHRLQVLPIVGSGVKGSQIRTVTGLDGNPSQDYIALESVGTSVIARLLKDRSEHYEVQGEVVIPSGKSELLLIQRVDVDLNGSSDYVFVYRTSVAAPQGSGEKPQRGFQFRFYDSRLKPLSVAGRGGSAEVLDFDNRRAVITDRFQWMRLGERLVPAWVTRGLTPELEKKPYDPWEPNPLDPPTYRLYYLSQEGLRSLSSPEKDSMILAQLAPSEAQKNAGQVSALVGSGFDTKIRYSVIEIIDGKIISTSPLLEDRYRNLRGIEAKEITSLDPTASWSGTGFASDSVHGAQRVTLLHHFQVSEGLTKARSPVDTVTSMAGVFVGRNRRAVIAQTIYDLHYHDLESDEVAEASLRRFSFLPSFFFFRTFFPVAIDDSRQGAGDDRLPAVFVSTGLGLSSAVDVITPRFGNDGRLESLVRPAKLRFQAQEGCQDVGNAIPATAQAPSQLMFFCGDRFVRAPLEY